jgi:pimeloyl-ACP methyl ester carboxylesterase
MTTLLLIHAFPVDAGMWDGQVAALGSDAEVLTPHLPGFGDTPSAGDVMTMDAAADVLAGELDKAGVDRAVVAGLSMGGYVAFSLWRRHRDRVAGLLLANTKSGADDEEGKAKRKGVAEKARTEGSGAIADAPPPLLSESADTALWDKVKEMIRRQSGDAIAAAALGMGERPDSTPILGEIDVPTTVLVSSGDTLIPAAVTEPMAKAIPGAELVSLDGAGHLSNLEDPEGFNRALRDLLSRAR